jgi:PilZ domain
VTTVSAAIEKRRHQPRLPAHMTASIVAPGQLSPAPCVVREVSFEGAKLELDGEWIIPKLFWLRIEGDVRLHYCVVVWRDGSSVGVEFPPHRNDWWAKICDRSRKLNTKIALLGRKS